MDSAASHASPDTLGHALTRGSVPMGYAAHLTHLPDKAPLTLVLMVVA